MQKLHPVYKNSINGSENKVGKSKKNPVVIARIRGKGFAAIPTLILTKNSVMVNYLFWFNSYESPYKIQYIFNDYPTAF